MLRHEVYYFRCDKFRSTDEIPFIFTILIIYNNNKPAFAYILNRLFYCIFTFFPLFFCTFPIFPLAIRVLIESFEAL